MAVTSQARPENNFDVPVIDWQAAGLLKPSVVKPVIATIEKTLIVRRLGRLGEKDIKALQEGLKTVLG